MSSVASNLAHIRERIAAAEKAAGRAPESVRLIAVSKTQPSSAIRAAYAAGQREFGENYAQELAEKATELRELSDIRWHMLGHLQRNKAKLVARDAHVLESLDSPELCAELSKRLSAGLNASRRLAVFVEVNLGGEAQKTGLAPVHLGELLTTIEHSPGLELRGLMCIPPLAAEPATRAYFRQLRELRDMHGGRRRLPELSMGMSADFEAAIAEGADVVRVGTAIFGARPG